MKKIIGLLVVSIALILSACSSSGSTNQDADDEEMGELIPELSLLTQLPEFDNETYESALLISEELKEIGLEIKFEPIDFNVLVDRLYSENIDSVDLWTLSWSGRAERVDPDIFIYSLFHSENIKPGSNNIHGFVNEEYDKLAEAQRTEVDQDKRQEIVHEAQEVLVEEIPLITLYVEELAHAYNHERFNNVIVMPGEGNFNEWMPINAKPLTDDKVIKIAAIQDLDTINPIGAIGEFDWRNIRLIYDKLVRLSPDGTVEAFAAESWEYIDDTTLEVTIRDGMTFHDGEPVTVDDIKFSYDYYIDHEVGYFQTYLSSIDNIEIKDEQTVVFNLTKPHAPFVNVTLAQIPILPKHIWENVVVEEGLSHPDQYDNSEMIGSGPFVFDGWNRGEYFRAKTNKDYYKDIAIDGYSYDIYAQDEAVLTALETGDADLNAEQLIPANIDRAKGMDHLTVQSVPDIGFNYLSFNQRKAPFNDKAFRKALAHLVDYETIYEVYLDGNALENMQGPGIAINSSNEFWHNPNLETFEYNPELAREILTEAGYTWDKDGRLHAPIGMALD